jgi:hypothetical protein
MPDGRMAALRRWFKGLRRGEESPGSTEARCRVTPGGGDPRESATENIPPSPALPYGTAWAARVKWCGKSAPRRRQRWWHGKPHREQDQVGAAGGRRHCADAAGRASRAAARVGRARRSATDVPDEWPSPRRRFAPMADHRSGTEPGLQTVWRFGSTATFCGCVRSGAQLILSRLTFA